MNEFKNLITRIKTFYSTNRTQKLAVSAVATTVVVGAVAFALLSTPVISPLVSNISDGATFTKDAEKDKLAKDEDKKDDKKEDTKKDEVKDEVKDEPKEDTGTAVNEDSTTPSPASNDSKPSSNQTAHTHDWQPNMITIPGTPPIYHHEHILGETKKVIYYTWADGCEVKATDYGAGGSAAAEAEHTAKHGQHEMGQRVDTVVIEPEVVRTLIQAEVPEHQEQRGWKCSCGATKE